MRSLNEQLSNDPNIVFSLMLIDPLKKSSIELTEFCTNIAKRNLSQSIVNGLRSVKLEISNQNSRYEDEIQGFAFSMHLKIEHMRRGVPKKRMQGYLKRLIALIETRAQGAEDIAKIINNIHADTEDDREVVSRLSNKSYALTKEAKQVLTMLNKMSQELEATWFSSARTLLTKCIGGLVSGASYILAPFKKLANMCYKAIVACFTKICDTLSQAASFVKNAAGFTRAKEQTNSTAPRSSVPSSTFNKQKVGEPLDSDTADEDFKFNWNPNTAQRL